MPRWASHHASRSPACAWSACRTVNEHDAAAGALRPGPWRLSPEGQSADQSDQFRWLVVFINGPGNPGLPTHGSAVLDFRKVSARQPA